MSKYDGWTIKALWRKPSWLIAQFFHSKRGEVIRAYEEEWGENYRKDREAGDVKLVKVELVEVE